MFEKLCALKNKKGFTLIEMLVVIGIIAVLVAIAVPVVGSATTKANAATDAANLRTIQASAAMLYLNDGDAADYSTLGTTLDMKTSGASEATLVLFLENGNITAYAKVGADKYYSVDDFATIAKDGGSLPETAAAPSGTGVEQLYPTAD